MMKKICLMSGAVINAGDFLIEKRSLDLIKHFLKDSEVTILNRVREDYSNRVDMLNGFDAVMFCGGPIYQPGVYGKSLPFVNARMLEENRVKPPVFFMGGGMKGNLYYSNFSSIDKIFFNQGLHENVPFGCRDVITYRFLKYQGYPALMTGCPCWYNLDVLEKEELRHPFTDLDSCRKICVSEPAREENVPYLIGLLKHLRYRFPSAVITLVIHREGKYSILSNRIIKELDVKIEHISGSVDGFKIYDDCDLHVGFRVHAHIYNLSIRNFTILFNEDIRGNGVNQTLGLENLNIERPPYRMKRIFGRYSLLEDMSMAIEPQIIIGRMFDDYLDWTIEQDFNNYKLAFQKMNHYFINMNTFFQAIKNVI